MYYWADLQSVHGFRYYDNIAPNAKFQRVLVLTQCLVMNVTHRHHSIFAALTTSVACVIEKPNGSFNIRVKGFVVEVT